jgi:hypothetical protein
MKITAKALTGIMAGLYFASPAQNCANGDFESSTPTVITSSVQVSGAVITAGMHNTQSTNCNPASCCPNNPAESAVINTSAGHNDIMISGFYPIYSVFGSVPGSTAAAAANPQLGVAMSGTNVLRLNSHQAGGPRIERMARTYTVTPSANMLDIAFVAVIARGHDCCFGTMFKVTVDTISCPVILASGATTSPCAGANNGITYYAIGSNTLASSSSFAVYSKWQIRRVDLSAYMGGTVNVNFYTSHCASSGHYGYAYVDTRCVAGEVMLNDTPVGFAAGTTTLCSSGTATLEAPPFFDTYSWNGPGGFTGTTSAITASAAGIYTLTLGQYAQCKPVVKTFKVVMSLPQVSVATTKSLSCVGEKVNLTASGLSTYSWSTGANSNTVSVTLTTTTTYTVSGVDANGCAASATFTQNVKVCPGFRELYNEATVNIFPNPGDGAFTVVADGLNGELIIENVVGQVLHRQPVSTGETRVLADHLPAGVYYCSVMKLERRLWSGKVVIQRR